MTLTFIILVLFISLCMYIIFAGADFGAGIVEGLFFKKNQNFSKLVKQSLGPVWEVNHIWLIIMIVILFNAFPEAFYQIMVSLHLPMVLILVGITFRGFAYAARFYAPEPTKFPFKRLFNLTSILTPFCLGITLSGLISGHTIQNPTGIYDHYIHNWLNLFGLSTGLFCIIICLFTALCFLLTEPNNESFRSSLKQKALQTSIILILTGGLVFLTGWITPSQFSYRFITHPLSIVCLIASSISLIYCIKTILSIPTTTSLLPKKTIIKLRLSTATTIFFIIAGCFADTFPNIILFNDGTGLSLYTLTAPIHILNILAVCLIIFTILCAPLLYQLFKLFK